MSTRDENAVPDLSQSFAELRVSARSLKDIETWLLQHPEVFAGTLPLYAINTSRVDVIPVRNIMASALTKQAFDVGLRVELNPGALHHPLLRSELDQHLVPDASPLTTTSMLTLRLCDWPVATAMVVARWVVHCMDPAHDVSDKRHELLLDEMLALHFPQVTVAQLRSMVETGLIPLTQNATGETRFGHIKDYLFASRKPYYNEASNLPFDIAS